VDRQRDRPLVEAARRSRARGTESASRKEGIASALPGDLPSSWVKIRNPVTARRRAAGSCRQPIKDLPPRSWRASSRRPRLQSPGSSPPRGANNRPAKTPGKDGSRRKSSLGRNITPGQPVWRPSRLFMPFPVGRASGTQRLSVVVPEVVFSRCEKISHARVTAAAEPPTGGRDHAEKPRRARRPVCVRSRDRSSLLSAC
jgi:hypothetical protein